MADKRLGHRCLSCGMPADEKGYCPQCKDVDVVEPSARRNGFSLQFPPDEPIDVPSPTRETRRHGCSPRRLR